jgi:alkaline phosphatase D
VSDPSRRDLLRLAGAAGASLVVGACGDNLATKPAGATTASAVFEPSSSGFLVSAWSEIERAVTIEVYDGARLVTRVRTEATMNQAIAAIDGLAASTTYRVEITGDGGTRTTHTASTAPATEDARPVRLAVSADLDPQPMFESDLFEQITAAAPEVFVTIGDVPYTDNGPPAMTVAAYRERHASLRTAPHVRPWLEAMGVIAIYDDHEFRNDWDAMFVAAEPERFAAAMQVWDEFFPLAATTPTDDRRYRSFRWGANVECFMLDCRRFRSANAAIDNAAKTMLGAAQKAWFKAALAQSTATFKLVFTSVPLDYGIGVDHWAGFTTEREELFAAIQAMGTTGILFLSGDQHYFAAYRHAYGLREFQVGPLARGLGTPGPNGPGVLFREVRYNFGLLDITSDTLTIQGVGPGGVVFYKETFSPEQLAPRPAV